MQYPNLDDPIRTIAYAAKMRDWDMIDAIISDRCACGHMGAKRGINDARKTLGLDAPLPALDRPAEVTIHDLASREGIEVIGRKGDIKRGQPGDSRKWRRRNAA